jgi:hypothetical protein
VSVDVEIVDKPPVRKLNYSHRAMIDLLLANPGMSQNDLAAHFGYSASWISTILCSDAFQAAFAARSAEVIDPMLAARVKVNFEAMVLRSEAILMEKLSQPATSVSDALALKAFELSTRAAGYGNRDRGTETKVDVSVHLNTLEGNLTKMLRRSREAIEGESTSEE